MVIILCQTFYFSSKICIKSDTFVDLVGGMIKTQSFGIRLL